MCESSSASYKDKSFVMKNSPLHILSNIAHMSVEDWYNHLAELARLVDGLGPVLGLVLLPAAAPAPGQQLAAHGDLGPDLELDVRMLS